MDFTFKLAYDAIFLGSGKLGKFNSWLSGAGDDDVFTC
ncbi:MAG: hypothetical protein UX42_C0007G0034 [Microgenomates group bacterium GW2011_GWC1_46_20]|nr:MAG: hypothetical protein UX42_C0007G0034 [Microgenomates group bacterium GW2011_GWC1_46_20]